jgi:hypothetical protein
VFHHQRQWACLRPHSQEWAIDKRRGRLLEENEQADLVILSIPAEDRQAVCQHAQTIWKKVFGSVRERKRARIDAGVKKAPVASDMLNPPPITNHMASKKA